MGKKVFVINDEKSDIGFRIIILIVEFYSIVNNVKVIFR